MSPYFQIRSWSACCSTSVPFDGVRVISAAAIAASIAAVSRHLAIIFGEESICQRQAVGA
jgi:hypothetical protein